MAVPQAQVDLLQGFVEACKQQPAILHAPELAFYREYLESLGANIPAGKAWEPPADETPAAAEPAPEKPAPMQGSDSSEEDVESDVELDLEFKTGPESEPVPVLPSAEKEITEEDVDVANDLRSQALTAMSDGDKDKALECFGKAIHLNPGSAVLYAKRAQLLVKMKRPTAACNDCDRALQLNPDSAIAYKQRGRAYRLLGDLDKAYKDLGQGQNIDYDDDTQELQKSLEKDVHRLQEHQNKQAQKQMERELKKKRKEVKRRREAAEKARQEAEANRGMPSGFPGGMPGGFPGGMPGGFPGGMPGGFPGGMPGAGGGMPGAGGGMPPGMAAGLQDLLGDPEILTAFSDPEVSAAFQDVSKNPANISKYTNNPKIMKVINAMGKKMGGGMPGGGMPGGGMPGGGMPGGGMPGASMPGDSAPPPHSSKYDTSDLD